MATTGQTRGRILRAAKEFKAVGGWPKVWPTQWDLGPPGPGLSVGRARPVKGSVQVGDS